MLAQQSDLSAPPDGAWTRLALRFEGQRVWSLLDGRPILTAEDDEFDAGGVSIGMYRRPSPDFDLLGLADELDDSSEADGGRRPTTRRSP